MSSSKKVTSFRKNHHDLSFSFQVLSHTLRRVSSWTMGKINAEGRREGIYKVGKAEDVAFLCPQIVKHSMVHDWTFGVLLTNCFRVASQTFGWSLRERSSLGFWLKRSMYWASNFRFKPKVKILITDEPYWT